MLKSFSFVLLTALVGTAHADLFIFDPNINPTAGYYVPQNGGHYNYSGAGQSYSNHWDPAVYGLGPDYQIGAFDFSQGAVTENPNSGLYCVATGGGCYNTATFYVAGTSTLLLNPGVGMADVGLYNPAGDPLGLIELSQGTDAEFGMLLFSRRDFQPISLSTEPSWFVTRLNSSHRVTVMHPQHPSQTVIEARFYDGSIDHFAISSVPEPSSMVFLSTLVLGLIGLGKCRGKLRA